MLKLSDVLIEALPGEKSAGAVIFKRTSKGIQYLLLFGDKIGWGFPKGHIDGDETPKETAIREIEEETGIIIDKFIPKFEAYTHYQMKQDFSKTPPVDLPKDKWFNKTVIFYLAEVDERVKVKISHEHEKYVWATYDAAQEKLIYNKEIIKKAKNAIEKGTRKKSFQKGMGNNKKL